MGMKCGVVAVHVLTAETEYFPLLKFGKGIDHDE